MLIAILLVLAALASLGAPAFQRTATEAVIKLVAVVGMSIFIGNSGVSSFGHVSFMAWGGYLSALLTMTPAKKVRAARSARHDRDDPAAVAVGDADRLCAARPWARLPSAIR